MGSHFFGRLKCSGKISKRPRNEKQNFTKININAIDGLIRKIGSFCFFRDNFDFLHDPNNILYNQTRE